MQIYLNENVYEMAKKRIRYVFEEFPNVIVNVSGGKDSTVVFNLALEVAREMGRLPLNVMWIDQEAEWQATVDMCDEWMRHPDVNPLWYQVPMKLFNATSTQEHWLECWAPHEEHRWMRPHADIAITENRYGTDRFQELFTNIFEVEYPDQKTCHLAGVRTEESPRRFLGMTAYAAYKGETWCKTNNAKLQHYTFYPIYDWSYQDVWAAIAKNGWSYNRIYDIQYQYGISAHAMRVSNVHHETAVHSLFYMQEAEPDTYQKLVDRIKGIDMATKMGVDDFFVKELPFMFKDWREYRDFLLEKLIANEEWKAGFRKIFDRQEKLYVDYVGNKLYQVHINSILTNDWEHIKLKNWEANPAMLVVRKKMRGVEYW